MQSIDMDDLIEYIFNELIKAGMVVNRDDIGIILDLELEYMIEKGFAVLMEEGEDDDEDV